MDKAIGILDSGVGGLSVWQEVEKHLPLESVIYLADQKNVPYGTRSADEIAQFACELVKILLNKNVKLIVIACNTISVTCLDRLRITFPDIAIVGTVPVIKKAAEVTRNKHVGILATKRTAESKYIQDLIKHTASDCVVTIHGTSTLVPFIERGEVTSNAFFDALTTELKQFKTENVDVLALGSTHFPLIRDQIQLILGNKVTLLDSGAAIARQVKRILDANNALRDTSQKAKSVFYTTGNKEQFDSVVKVLISQSIDSLEVVK